MREKKIEDRKYVIASQRLTDRLKTAGVKFMRLPKY